MIRAFSIFASLASQDSFKANKTRICYYPSMDEGRKRVIGIMAAILASLHMERADDLFGGPQGSPPDGQVNIRIRTMGGGNYAED